MAALIDDINIETIELGHFFSTALMLRVVYKYQPHFFEIRYTSSPSVPRRYTIKSITLFIKISDWNKILWDPRVIDKGDDGRFKKEPIVIFLILCFKDERLALSKKGKKKKEGNGGKGDQKRQRLILGGLSFLVGGSG